MYEKFNIIKKDIVTITGAGGKTSLMFLLANELSNFGKVLLTTTTKIKVPKESEFEKLIVENKLMDGKNKNIFVIGEKIENSKIVGLDYETIDKYRNQFDYILIEGDGAKEKLIKFWNDTEPCIPEYSTKIVGVLNLDIFNMKLNKENVHRYEILEKVLPNYIEKNIDENFLVEYIKKAKYFDENKNGEKFLFINGIDGIDKDKKEKVGMFIKKKLEDKKYKVKVILGSIK